MKKRWMILCVGMCFAETWTDKQFLETNLESHSLEKAKLQDEKLEALPSVKLWDELGFRYELDGFEGDRHEFQIRYTPFNVFEWNLLGDLREVKRKEIAEKKKRILKKKLVKKWHFLLRLESQKRKELHWEEMEVLNKQRIEWVGTNMESETFNPRHLLEAKKAALELSVEKINLAREKKNLEADLNVWTAGTVKVVSYEKAKWLNAKNIAEWLEKMNVPRLNHEKDFDVEKAKIRYELSKVKGNQFFDYVKFGYEMRVPKDAEVRISTEAKYWSLGVGFHLPFLDGEGQSQLSRKYDYDSEKMSETEREISFQKEWQKKKLSLETELNQLQMMEEFMEQAKEKKWFEHYKEFVGEDGAELLNIKESEIEERYAREKQYLNVLEKYLDFVEVSFGLDELPLNVLEMAP